jgi:integrase
MPIHWDKRNGAFRFTYNRVVEGKRYRSSRLLPKAWSRAEAEAYNVREVGRLHTAATGGRTDELISEAVKKYLTDKEHLKSIKTATEHLAAIAWAYDGKTMSQLAKVSEAVRKMPWAPATIHQRLALLKAACRWGWKHHGMAKSDPTSAMILPSVSNARHLYLTRADMLRICRACKSWRAQVAIRVAFYTGMRLSELLRAVPDGNALVLADSKNGQPRAVPVHPKARHLLQFFPLPGSKRGIQAAFTKACKAVKISAHFHDLRHSTASAMVNAGVSLETIAKVLGQKDSRSTRRYAHLEQATLEAAVATIGKRA